MTNIAKTLIQICVVLFFFSCSKKEISVINKSNKDSSLINSNKINHKPLFLGLSPYMTDKEYNSQIQKLNSEGILDGVNFTINDNSEFSTFKVSKTSNSIRLEFDDLITVIQSPNENNNNVEKQENSNYKLEKNKILKIFNDKYKKSEFKLPEDIDLSKFNFKQDNYVLYKDIDKYVLFGYSIPTETNSVNINENKDSNGKKLFGSDVMLSKTDKFVSYDYGLKVQIDYLEIIDMDKILDLINKESSKKIENQKTEDKAKT